MQSSHIVAILCMHLFFILDVAFNNIAGLKVLKVDKADTTLVALRNRVNLRLEAAQCPDSALCQNFVSSHNANIAPLLNDAIRTPATGDVTGTADVEDFLDEGSTDIFSLRRR